jgi:hypothetical protein
MVGNGPQALTLRWGRTEFDEGEVSLLVATVVDDVHFCGKSRLSADVEF